MKKVRVCATIAGNDSLHNQLSKFLGPMLYAIPRTHNIHKYHNFHCPPFVERDDLLKAVGLSGFEGGKGFRRLLLSI